MAGKTEGEKLYESASDARRNGDHATYAALVADLIAYNERQAAARRSRTAFAA